MAQIWEVIGGADAGGIIVRAGYELGSQRLPTRLSTGALIQERELAGNRLSFQRLEGTGPNAGWISISVNDKALVVRTTRTPVKADAEPAQSPPVTGSRVSDEVASKRCGAIDSDGGLGRTDLPKDDEVPGVPLKPAAVAATKLKRLLAALASPVTTVLTLRAELESNSNAASVQRRLTDQELRLSKALEEVRAAADDIDPPPEPARLRLRCASPSCKFRVHTREGLGGYCCITCWRSGGHGQRCQRVLAPPGADRAKKSSVPVAQEQLALVELEEGVRLLKGSLDFKPWVGPRDSELLSDSGWSRSGRKAIGTWVSSIIDDQLGDPDTAGPAQLLEGGYWISRKGLHISQWIVFDLGQSSAVSEVRVRSHHMNPGFSPRGMRWQCGTGLDGSWQTVVEFAGTNDGAWTSVSVEPPVRSRWWRLHMASNWGSHEYVWLHGFALRVSREGKKDGDLRGGAVQEAVEDGSEEREKEADAKSEQPAETSPSARKRTHKTWSCRELRRNDEGWKQLTGYEKLLMHALLSDRVLALQDKPYIDCRLHDVVEYARSFRDYPAEMGWSLDFNPDFFCELTYEGLIPTSIQIHSDNHSMVQILTPCFEQERHILDCLGVHVSKNARKRAKHYTMTIDSAYDDVMLGCIRQHGEGWLYRGERWVLRKLRKDGYNGDRGIRFAIHSFELWDEKGQLVAGDLGYTVGGLYVSMTGFHKDGTAGAGEVQLVLTAALLHKMGHEWFDLGQAMKYKEALGARTLARAAWLERFYTVRDKECSFEHERIDGAELLAYLLQHAGPRRQKERHTEAAGSPLTSGEAARAPAAEEAPASLPLASESVAASMASTGSKCKDSTAQEDGHEVKSSAERYSIADGDSPEEHYIGSDDGDQPQEGAAGRVRTGPADADQHGQLSSTDAQSTAADAALESPVAVEASPKVEASQKQDTVLEASPATTEDANMRSDLLEGPAVVSTAQHDTSTASIEVQKEPQSECELAPAECEEVAYEVLHKRVAVREKPSMKGQILGILSKAERVTGTPYAFGGLPWLRLPPNAPKLPSWRRPSPPSKQLQGGKSRMDDETAPEVDVHCLVCGQAVASLEHSEGDFCQTGPGERIWYVGRFSRVRVDGTIEDTISQEAVPVHAGRLIGWRRKSCQCTQCASCIGWRYERKQSPPFWELAWEALREGHPCGSAWVLIDSSDTDLGLGNLLRPVQQQKDKDRGKEYVVAAVPWASIMPSKLAHPRPRSIFGQVYVQEDALGLASFHFRDPTNAFISYTHPLCDEYPSLSDGSRPPACKPFDGVSYDVSSCTFRGTISWEPAAWFGTERWEYTMVFSNDFEVISGGEVRLFGLFAEAEDEPEEVLEFGVALHYRRVPRPASPEEGPLLQLTEEAAARVASTSEIARAVLVGLFSKLAIASSERAARPLVCRYLLKAVYRRVADGVARICTWEVTFKRVVVRDAPSINAKIVTLVLKGDRVRGAQFEVAGVPWLRLEPGASQAQPLDHGHNGWILIDATNTSLQLGVLLTHVPEEDSGWPYVISAGTRVTISSLAGEVCTMMADGSWTLHELQVAVESATGINAREQRLFLGRTELLCTSQLRTAFSGEGSVSISMLRRPPEQALWLEKVQEDWRLLAKAPEDVRGDREVMLKALAKDWNAVRHVAKDLLADSEFALEAVAFGPEILGRLAPQLHADREVVLAAVRRDGGALRYAAEELQADREVVLAAVGTAGRALRFAAEALRADREVVLASVRQDWNAFDCAAPGLRDDREIALLGVSQHGSLLKSLAPPLRADREVVLAAVRQSGRALKHAVERLFADPEIAEAAVRQDGEVLKDLPKNVRTRREVVLAAVSQSGQALQHAPESLRADREVVLAAVRQSRSAITHAAGKLRGDSEILLLAAAKAHALKDMASMERLEFGAPRTSPTFERLATLPEHLEQFTALHTLELMNNSLSSLPRSFGRMGNLKVLKLTNNKLAALPHSFGFLSWLSELWLDFNQLKELPQTFGQLGALRILGLSYNQLAVLPDSIGQLCLLEDLNLTSNRLQALPEHIGQLSALRNARFYGNQLAALPESIGELSALHWMLLGANKLTSLPSSLGDLEHLEALDMAPQCPGGHFLRRFITRSAYRSFYCNLCRGSSKAGDAMWGCRSCNFDACTQCLEVPQLKSLPESLTQLTTLRTLRVVNQQLPALPPEIGLLSSLQTLGLSSNRLSCLPEKFLGLKLLQTLDLGDNCLDALPDGLGELTELQELDVSVNALKALPESIGRLAALKRLNLSSNSLQELPESFGSLVGLRELDLDKNKLKGLPSTFQQLNSLPKGWTYSNSDFSMSSMSSQAPAATAGRGLPLRMFNSRHFA